MHNRYLIRVFVLLVATWAVFASALIRRAAAEPAVSVPSAAEPRSGVLLLNDGGVLAGQIAQSTDRYLVVRGSAEISVPAANVTMVCDTLEEAYLRQRTEMQSPTADTHLALADWCLRCGLCPQAADELLAARGLDPRHPKLELLERRIAVIGRPAPPRQSTPASATNSPPVQSNDTGPAPASVGELPSGVVERFTRKVQPLVVNNCTIAGCHRPGGPHSFQLDRALLHGMANRRSTMTNLAAVLTLVNRERPRESPLLTIPRRDHGGMNHPIFGPRQSPQLQQLVEWVAMVTETSSADEIPPAETEQATAPATAPAVEPLPIPPRWQEPGKRVAYEHDGKVHLPSQVEQAAAIRSADEKSIGAAAEAADFDDTTLPPFTPSQLRYAVRARAWQPRDPFDPEIFNRQRRQVIPQQPTRPQPRHAAATAHD